MFEKKKKEWKVLESKLKMEQRRRKPGKRVRGTPGNPRGAPAQTQAFAAPALD